MKKSELKFTSDLLDLGSVMHACNSNTWEAKAVGLSSRLPWAT